MYEPPSGRYGPPSASQRPPSAVRDLLLRHRDLQVDPKRRFAAMMLGAALNIGLAAAAYYAAPHLGFAGVVVLVNVIVGLFLLRVVMRAATGSTVAELLCDVRQVMTATGDNPGVKVMLGNVWENVVETWQSEDGDNQSWIDTDSVAVRRSKWRHYRAGRS